MKAWLQILRIVPNSSILFPTLGTHPNPKAVFIRKWEFFFTYLPECMLMSHGNYWHQHMYLVKSHILSAPKTSEPFLREPKKCRVGFFFAGWSLWRSVFLLAIISKSASPTASLASLATQPPAGLRLAGGVSFAEKNWGRKGSSKGSQQKKSVKNKIKKIYGREKR